MPAICFRTNSFGELPAGAAAVSSFKRGTKISGIALSPVRAEKRSEQKTYEIKRNNFMPRGRGISGCGRTPEDCGISGRSRESEETVYGIKEQNQCRQNQRRDKAPAAHLSGDGNRARRKKRLQNGMKFYMRFHEQHRDLRIFSHFNGCVLESPQVPGAAFIVCHQDSSAGIGNPALRRRSGFLFCRCKSRSP